MSAEAPLFDVTVTRSGREEHVLRLEGEDSAPAEEPTAERDAPEPAPLPLSPAVTASEPAVSARDEEEALYSKMRACLSALDPGTAEWNATVLRLARRVEALGIGVVNVLNAELIAEHDVLRFERSGKTLDWRRFARMPFEGTHLRGERSAIEEEAQAIALEAEGPFIMLGRNEEERLREKEEHQEYLAARRAKLEERRKKLGEEQAVIGAEWKALDVLPEIIHRVPRALASWRVRYSLEWLRGLRLMFREEDLPPELGGLLDVIGQKVAHPKKYTRWKASEQERKVLYLWGMRTHLSRDAREKRAGELGFGSGESSGAWESLERVARRYVARSRAKVAPVQEVETEEEL